MLLLLGSPTAIFADDNDIAKLDASCELARQAKIKPLHEMEIAKCKASGRHDPGYCERYWKDYGNAVRLKNGAMGPRLFSDLPECVAAAQARATLDLSGR